MAQPQCAIAGLRRCVTCHYLGLRSDRRRCRAPPTSLRAPRGPGASRDSQGYRVRASMAAVRSVLKDIRTGGPCCCASAQDSIRHFILARRCLPPSCLFSAELNSIPEPISALLRQACAKALRPCWICVCKMHGLHGLRYFKVEHFLRAIWPLTGVQDDVIRSTPDLCNASPECLQ